jgi:hypothetical protein
MRKVLTGKFNAAFNSSLKKSKDLFAIDNFVDIQIVQEDISSTRLLHCSVKLSSNITYNEEILIGEIVDVHASKSKQDLLHSKDDDLEREVNEDEDINQVR